MDTDAGRGEVTWGKDAVSAWTEAESGVGA